MSTPEPSVANRSEEPAPATFRQGVVAVAVLAVIAAIIILNLAFSTANTPSSVDGRTATTSQHVN
ncbi:MAG: hypothetical protein KY441_05180 [Actinobacteria bacterium]|nr:hypothetical protein [Actinomycetota bacterium]